MKSYTDLEQSKKLAEILPIESADMWWSKNFIYYNPTAAIGISAEYSNVYTYKFGEDDIPCWSLATLLDILRNRAYSIDEDAIVTLSSYKTIEWDLSISNSGLYMITKSDPIDACVEMIVTLKEKDLL